MKTKINELARVRFADLPTAVEPLVELSGALKGPDIWVKRDDQTGLAMGGNKTRKLEFLIAEAMRQGATCVITAGAAQSNHCRQTAAAATKAGLGCHLVLVGSKPEKSNGNLLLDELLGATVHWCTREERPSLMVSLEEELKAKGEKPYVIPVGGSNEVGAIGYVVAMQELWGQLAGMNDDWADGPTHIVFATGSGGTQAGLVLGAKIVGYEGEMIGVNVSKGGGDGPSFEEQMSEIANRCAEMIGAEARTTADDFEVNQDYLGEGYGIVTDAERESISLLARLEGLLVCPVYSGRAMAGLLDMARKGRFKKGDRVLFWHTGGSPALFAYRDDLGV
ncbi:D-cysteine desulfhydrase family protein [Poriferisphaera sp. WC338]|uniref:D-cysteine desulfhydrase family protein n=1 Tax=Poriferisphaera sp. WC338 TaxID=3425129 RepID=UPI003D8195A1